AAPHWRVYSGAEPDDGRVAVALNAGLRAGVGVPVWQSQHLIGVLDFCSQEAVEPDPEVLETLTGLATQLGLLLERTSADEQLRRTTANLQRSNTELQQFAYVASHDLFEPLRMVTSYLELLSQRCGHQLDALGREFIASALDGARRMDALIRDLLAYSRVDLRGRSLEPVNFERVFQEALDNLKVAIQESGAAITDGPLPRVRGDSVQLTQVLQNLIGNAIKFRGSEPPRIEVTAEAREQEWVFRVRDNGIGIEPKQFDRLFVIFQRLHTRQEYAGTGMGLAICKKIIERHGGRIWVESAPGQGSAFLFTLPMVQE
ncbi:MAG: sensor histidine kinase, partial [Limisphaerales bacterium]